MAFNTQSYVHLDEAADVGRGRMRVITGTNPAAGAGALETVPTSKRWLLQGITVRLVTSAVVGNRYVYLAMDDGTSAFYFGPAGVVQIVAQTIDYGAGVGLENAQTPAYGGFLSLPLPAVVLEAGWRWYITAVGLLAGDDFGAPVYLVQEYDV